MGTAAAVPPLAGTRMIGSLARPSNRMMSLVPQVPSAPVGASQMTLDGPPPTLTFLSFPPAMNARNRLSGDQNGRKLAPSLPGRGRASSEESGRIQVWDAHAER